MQLRHRLNNRPAAPDCTADTEIRKAWFSNRRIRSSVAAPTSFAVPTRRRFECEVNLSFDGADSIGRFPIRWKGGEGGEL